MRFLWEWNYWLPHCKIGLHMEKAASIIKWFIIIVVVAYFAPLVIRDGIPFVTQQAKSLTATLATF